MSTALPLPTDPGTDADSFRRALRRHAAGVVLVTTRDAAGVPRGIVATAFSSVTADPPTVLVCINRASSIHDPLAQSGVFCVNLLDRDGAATAAAFSDSDARAADLARAAWAPLSTGAPALSGAAAALDCRVVHLIEEGTHSIVIGRVAALRLADTPADPLLYWDGDYGQAVRLPPV